MTPAQKLENAVQSVRQLETETNFGQRLELALRARSWMDEVAKDLLIVQLKAEKDIKDATDAAHAVRAAAKGLKVKGG